MKKFLLLLLAIFSVIVTQGQLTYKDVVVGTGTSGNGRSPQSSHYNTKTVYIITAAEMSAISAGTALKGIAFKYKPDAIGTAATPSNMKIYLQNTTDAAYNKGTSFTNALVGMTKVSDGTITAGGVETLEIPFQNGDPFVYSGGAVYVAFEYTNTGTKGSANTAYCNSALVGGANGLAGSLSTTATASNTLTSSNYRSTTSFGYEELVNDFGVSKVYAMSKAPINETSQAVKAIISNNGVLPGSNLQIKLTVSGANSFTSTKTIASLAASATELVEFDSFVSTTTGTNQITVSIEGLNDENNNNNSLQFSQEATKGIFSHNLGTGITNNYGYGDGEGIMGIKYKATGTVTLKGIRFAVGSTTGAASRPVKAVLLDKDGNTLTTSAIYNLEDVDNQTWLILNFQDQTISITDDEFFVALAQVGDEAFYPFAVEAEDPLRTNTYFGSGTYNEGGVTSLSAITRKVTMEALTSNNTLGTIDVSTSVVYSLAKNPLIYGGGEVISALVKNDGDMVAIDYPVTLTVSGANTFTSSKTVKIPAGASAKVIFDAFTATAKGINTLAVTPNAEASKALSITQEITDGTFSYVNNDPIASNYGSNSGNLIFMVKYHMTGVKKIKSVRATIGNNTNNPGKIIFAVLTDASGNILARSDNYTILDEDKGQIKDFLLQIPTQISDADFLVGIAMAEGNTGFFPMATQAESPIRAGAYYTRNTADAGFTLNSSTNGRYMLSALTEDAVVPVTFSAFTATLNNAKTRLSWSVGTEHNVSHYVVERKVGEGSFTAIAEIPAEGKANYSIIDENPHIGTNYYRLKSVDNDGLQSYFNEIRSVKVLDLGNKSVSIYPNPVTGNNITINMSGYAEGNYQYQLVDLSGKIIANGIFNNTGSNILNVGNVGSGVYLLKIINGIETSQIKLIKK